MWSEFLDRLIADGKKCLQQKSGTDYPRDTAGLEALDAARRLLVSWAIVVHILLTLFAPRS
jgi:hypothetical protein